MYHGNRSASINKEYQVTLLTNVADEMTVTGESEGLSRVKSFAFIAGLISIAKKTIINDISDLKGTSLGVLDKDITNIRYFLNDGKDIKFISCEKMDEMLNMLKADEFEYMAIPGNQYINIRP